MIRVVHRSWFTPRFLPTLERYFLACRIESWTFGVYIYIYWTICSRGLQWKLIAVVARGQCAFRRRNFVIRRENGGIVFIASPCIFRRKDRDIRRLFYPTSGTSMWIIRRGSKLSLSFFSFPSVAFRGSISEIYFETRRSGWDRLIVQFSRRVKIEREAV